MKEYVVGFMFDDTGERITLIRKNRPEWQAGKLNGVGDKVEPNETPMAAMIREFREETGVETTSSDWTNFTFMWGDAWEIAFYKGFNTKLLESTDTKTDEQIERRSVDRVVFYDKGAEGINNLKWLVPLALDKNKIFVDAHYQ